jgi:hypothetical protein
MPNALSAGIANDLAQSFHPFAVPLLARQSALLRPTPIAIHNNGNMGGNILGVSL